MAGQWEDARAYYRWPMPIFHLDTSPKLVQYIKLGRQVMGLGSEVTRAPRLAREGEERARIIALFESTAVERPDLTGSASLAAG